MIVQVNFLLASVEVATSEHVARRAVIADGLSALLGGSASLRRAPSEQAYSVAHPNPGNTPQSDLCVGSRRA
jgi:hypothetical protein